MTRPVGVWPAGRGQFAKSVHSLSQRPRWTRREIAVVGRSNSGKSSLINALLGVGGLARTSKTPGRTRALNFFVLGEGLALADLPGYGYAAISRAAAQGLSELLYGYLRTDDRLIGAVLVADARRGAQAEEIALAELIRARGLALILALNKCDKLAQRERQAAIKRFAMLATDVVLCSALDGEGIVELRRRLGELCGPVSEKLARD